jgi:hypothetical protein
MTNTSQPTDRQAAFEALPGPLQSDVQLVLLLAQAMTHGPDIGWALDAAASLVASYRVREQAAAAVAGGAQ